MAQIIFDNINLEDYGKIEEIHRETYDLTANFHDKETGNKGSYFLHFDIHDGNFEDIDVRDEKLDMGDIKCSESEQDDLYDRLVDIVKAMGM